MPPQPKKLGLVALVSRKQKRKDERKEIKQRKGQANHLKKKPPQQQPAAGTPCSQGPRASAQSTSSSGGAASGTNNSTPPPKKKRRLDEATGAGRSAKGLTKAAAPEPVAAVKPLKYFNPAAAKPANQPPKPRKTALELRLEALGGSDGDDDDDDEGDEDGGGDDDEDDFLPNVHPEDAEIAYLEKKLGLSKAKTGGAWSKLDKEYAEDGLAGFLDFLTDLDRVTARGKGAKVGKGGAQKAEAALAAALAVVSGKNGGKSASAKKGGTKLAADDNDEEISDELLSEDDDSEDDDEDDGNNEEDYEAMRDAVYSELPTDNELTDDDEYGAVENNEDDSGDDGDDATCSGWAGSSKRVRFGANQHQHIQEDDDEDEDEDEDLDEEEDDEEDEEDFDDGDHEEEQEEDGEEDEEELEARPKKGDGRNRMAEHRTESLSASSSGAISTDPLIAKEDEEIAYLEKKLGMGSSARKEKVFFLFLRRPIRAWR